MVKQGNALIGRKLQRPCAASRLAERPRLTGRILDYTDSRRITAVNGSPGSGKTTAVADALAHTNTPAAWLTLANTDRRPMRLVTYLEAAVAGQVPHAAGAAANALQLGLSPEEAAGLLVEATDGQELLLVLDDVERIVTETAALAVIDAVLTYAPPSLRLVLISNRHIPVDLVQPRLDGELAIIGDADLAFTEDEAISALLARGDSYTDSRQAIEHTGGWVAGVLLYAMRHQEGLAPICEYITTHVMSNLEEPDRDFLVKTSAIAEVTIERAHALGEATAGERLASLRRFDLPIDWDAAGGTMTCRPCFREYLERLLEQRPRFEVSQLRAASAELTKSVHPVSTVGGTAPAVATGAADTCVIQFAEFGQPRLSVDGKDVQPRIKKSYELLAYLATKPMLEADRDELLEALFGGRDDDSTRSYLRQAAHRLRETLPPEATLAFTANRLRLSGSIMLVSDATRAEALVAEASATRERATLQPLLDALAILDRGEYLAGINSGWIDDRRGEFAELAAKARHGAAELLSAQAEYVAATHLAKAALRTDPYRETTWRLLMQIARAADDENGVISAYRGCKDALSEIGTVPSPATQSLLTSLRR